jgi:transposase
MKELDPLVREAISGIQVHIGPGHTYNFTLENRVKLLLIKQLVGESNRMSSGMPVIFSMLSDIDVSYKSVERLYSDMEVIIAIHYLHILLPKKKGRITGSISIITARVKASAMDTAPNVLGSMV